MRLIDADKIEPVGSCIKCALDAPECELVKAFRNAPILGIEPIKHGLWEDKVKRWANDTDIYVSNTCNLCKEESYGMYHYCPNCGAKMDLDEVEK